MTVVETYEPTGTLKPIADGVWIVDGPVIRFGYLGIRFPFPTRTTVVRHHRKKGVRGLTPALDVIPPLP